MNKLIIIYGPTASGKTNLSLKLSSMLNAPILNMDSKQIYYHLSDLTASPSIEEQRSIPHYFFNDKSSNYEANVENWYREVTNLLNSGMYKNYILVGGSGFYLKYFLTPGFHSQNSMIHGKLINNYLNNFSWQNIMRIFKLENESSIISRFIPHCNDKFRQFNYLKSYFQRRFSGENLLTYNKNMEINKDEEIPKSFSLKKTLIIVNPNFSQLKENIHMRTPTLLSQKTREEGIFVKNHLYCTNGFRTIIGFKEITDELLTTEEVINTIELKTLFYAKQQKKWILQFMNYNPILLENSNYYENFSILNSVIFDNY